MLGRLKMTKGLDRVRLASLHDKIVSVEQALDLIPDGAVLGASGFGGAGDAKAVPLALAAQAKVKNITFATGASLGNQIDGKLGAAKVISRRLPYQADPGLRKQINNGEVMYTDQHLSGMADKMRHKMLPAPQVVVISAVAITEDGLIIPTNSCGNSAQFAEMADHVIVEIDLTSNPILEGSHDIYVPASRPKRGPVPLTEVQDRIGKIGIQVDPAKISAIVMNDVPDTTFDMADADEETLAIDRKSVV